MSGFAAGTCQTVRFGIGGISVLSLVNICLTAVFPGMVEQLVFYGMAALPSDAVPRRLLLKVCLHKRPSMDALLVRPAGFGRGAPGIDNESDQVP